MRANLRRPFRPGMLTGGRRLSAYRGSSFCLRAWFCRMLRKACGAHRGSSEECAPRGEPAASPAGCPRLIYAFHCNASAGCKSFAKLSIRCVQTLARLQRCDVACLGFGFVLRLALCAVFAFLVFIPLLGLARRLLTSGVRCCLVALASG